MFLKNGLISHLRPSLSIIIRQRIAKLDFACQTSTHSHTGNKGVKLTDGNHKMTRESTETHLGMQEV